MNDWQLKYGQQQARNAVFMGAMATLARDPRKRSAAQHWVKAADDAAAAVRLEDFSVARVNSTTEIPRRIHPDWEATRDPIYLLQSRRWHCVNVDQYWWDSDAEVLKTAVDDVEVDEKYMRESDDFMDSWDVEGVWFTRKEAEDFGSATHYRYAHGHRVYCVCADGELAKLLLAHTDREKK